MTTLSPSAEATTHDAEAFPSFRLPAGSALRALLTPIGAKRWLGADVPGGRLNPGCAIALPDGRTGTVQTVGDEHIVLVLTGHDGAGSSVELRLRATGERRSTIDVTPAHAGLDPVLAAAEDVVWDAVDRRTPRQAVVLIHGIGEQAPGATIRQFASAVVPNQDHLLSKPDRFAPHFELRRLQAFADSASDRPRTDFFEYYWAHKLRDTPKRQVITWLLGLAKRPRKETPAQLHALWWLVRAVPFVLGLFVANLLVVFGLNEIRGAWSRIAGLAPLAFVFSAITGAITRFLTTSLGDAARYLTAHPANIEVRTEIRDGGIDLLRQSRQVAGTTASSSSATASVA